MKGFELATSITVYERFIHYATNILNLIKYIYYSKTSELKITFLLLYIIVNLQNVNIASITLHDSSTVTCNLFQTANLFTNLGDRVHVAAHWFAHA